MKNCLNFILNILFRNKTKLNIEAWRQCSVKLQLILYYRAENTGGTKYLNLRICVIGT